MSYIRLPLKHTFNTRELGGYSTREGCTRFQTFLRSDDLATLSTEDLLFLQNYGIKHVIDLRSDWEQKLYPHPTESHFSYSHIPLSSDEVADVHNFNFRDFSLDKFYLQCLEEKGKEIQIIFEQFAEEEGGILFHCAAGKDRTGVISALLLGLCEVSEADIIANYQVSYTYLKRKPDYQNETFSFSTDLLKSESEMMENMLKQLSLTYGTVENYLLQQGVSQNQLSKIKKKFIAY